MDYLLLGEYIFYWNSLYKCCDGGMLRGSTLSGKWLCVNHVGVDLLHMHVLWLAWRYSIILFQLFHLYYLFSCQHTCWYFFLCTHYCINISNFLDWQVFHASMYNNIVTMWNKMELSVPSNCVIGLLHLKVNSTTTHSLSSSQLPCVETPAC